MNKKALIIFLVCSLALAGFPSWNAFAQVPKEFLRLRTNYQGMPAEAATGPGGKVPEYYLAPNDKIEIYVWQNPDLSKEITIRPDGKISYPLIGTVDVAGLSIDQLQEVLKQKISEYIRFPQVIVSLRESAGNKIIVLGQVNYPGIFPFKGNSLSIIEAIAMAGDFTPDSRRESVMIISDNFTDHPTVRKVNLLGAIRNGVATEKFFLKPNDVLYVPRSTIADVSKFMNDIQPIVNGLTTLMGLGTNYISTATQFKAYFWHRGIKVIPSNDQ